MSHFTVLPTFDSLQCRTLKSWMMAHSISQGRKPATNKFASILWSQRRVWQEPEFNFAAKYLDAVWNLDFSRTEANKSFYSHSTTQFIQGHSWYWPLGAFCLLCFKKKKKKKRLTCIFKHPREASWKGEINFHKLSQYSLPKYKKLEFSSL